MIRNYLIPLLAVAGLGFGIFTMISGASTPPPVSRPAFSTPAQSPYQSFVAGAGIVESSTENIGIGTQVSGVVSKIYVQVGSHVKAGSPLFSIDDRAARAALAQSRAAVQEAKAELTSSKNQLAFAESIKDKRAISEQDLASRRDAMMVSEAKLERAQADLKAAETDLDRLIVRAPVDGDVLQLNIHPGEFAPANVLATPLILFGNIRTLNVRVDVDENDAWRIRNGMPATGYLRGNRQIKTPLQFVRFEPYVVPKRSLTGDNNERVDTRVLQVIFAFTRGDLPIYVGQQMDVFIDAPSQKAAVSGKGGKA